jgi:chemotaxis protein CheC
MKLPAGQRDALREMINIGYGRAAASLSDLISERITLEVPQVDVYFLDEILEALHQIYHDDVWSVHQIFSGTMKGQAIFVLDKQSATALAAAILRRNESGADDHEAQEALCEAGNIVLQAALGVCGDLLRVHVRFAAPNLKTKSIAVLLQSAVIEETGLEYALLVRTRFRILSRQVTGYMVVILGIDSFNQLLAAVQAWEEQSTG